jgi:hypothetical protein
MKKFILFVFLFNLFHNIFTWIGGPNVTPDAFKKRIIEPLPRQRFSSFKIDNDLYLFGGRFSQVVRIREINNEMWKYSLTTKNWILIKNGTGN